MTDEDSKQAASTIGTVGEPKTRKVQRLGTSTLGVTVPAAWTRRHDIDKGDDLVIQRDENSGSLLLVPDQDQFQEDETTIDAGSFAAERLRRAVVTEYVLGRRLVRIESSSDLGPDRLDALRAVERQLMGLGIIEETAKGVTIRCSIAPDDFELPTLLERLGRTEATMRNDAVVALVTGDTALARRVTERQGQVEKFFFLFLRLLFATYRNPRLNRTIGFKTGFPLIGYRSIVQDTILMSDIARDIARLTIDRDTSDIEGDSVERLRELNDAVEEAAATARIAVTDPTRDTVADALAALPVAERRTSEANDYLDRERPEPLLTLQRAVFLLARDVRHVRDTVDVAARLALRNDGSTDASG